MMPGKGILAADESRRAYRQMLITTPSLEQCISGAILFDETLEQRADDGRRFVEILVDRGIIPGVKVDRGAKALPGVPGELITEGLDGLRERLTERRQWCRSSSPRSSWKERIHSSMTST